MATDPTTTNATTGTSSTTASSTATATNTEFRIRLGYLSSYLPTSSTVAGAIASIGTGTTTGTSSTASAQYPGILAPLAATNGLMFPFAPAITNSQDVDYGTMSMVHANTDYHAYNHTPNVTIGISGKFAIQTYQDGIYAIAAIHFLRTVSRMYFGETDAQTGNAGIPPPILQLNGYGTYMYNMIRCYVKSHSFSFDENMDTVNIQMGTGYYVRLPALFTLQVSLVVQNTTRAQRKDFNLSDFQSGKLMQTTPNSSGWI